MFVGIKTHNSLTETLQQDPYYHNLETAVNKALSENPYISGKELKVESLLDSDYLQEYYDKAIELKKDIALEEGIEFDENAVLYSFKGAARRAINCGVVSATLVTPMHAKPLRYMCKGRGCTTCASYKASKVLNYADSIIRYGIFDDPDLSFEYVTELKALFKDKGWKWLSVVSTPLANGKEMVRISNLLEDQANPLIDDDNEVKHSIAYIDELYGFDNVVRTSPKEAMETQYLTGSGIVFTSTDLYKGKGEGRSSRRERGDNGVKFVDENGLIVHMPKSHYREMLDKEEKKSGVVKKVNMPIINLDGVSEEDTRSSLGEAIKEHSTHETKATFGISHEDQMAHVTVELTNSWRNNLQKRGYEQPHAFTVVHITESLYNETMEKVAHPDIGNIPDDIETMYIDPKFDPRLKKLMKSLENFNLIQVQNRFRNAMTIEELVDHILNSLKFDNQKARPKIPI